FKRFINDRARAVRAACRARRPRAIQPLRTQGQDHGVHGDGNSADRPVRKGVGPDPRPRTVPDLPPVQRDLRVDVRRTAGVDVRGPPPRNTRTTGTSAAEQLPPAFPERAAWGTAGKLRAWQAEALELYFKKQPKDFLAVATPGAGKTTFALRLAA